MPGLGQGHKGAKWKRRVCVPAWARTLADTHRTGRHKKK